MTFLARAARLVQAVGRRSRAAIGRWYPVRVRGISMIPTLRPGDLLAVRFPGPGEPRAGQVVVATTDRRELVKRVIAGPGERVHGRVLDPDEFWLEGDNAGGSTDSRTTGPVGRREIMGVVRARYWPPSRVGRL